MNSRSDIWKFLDYHILNHHNPHHRKVEDEDVCGAPHGLVKDDDEGNEKVPNEADDDHQGEDNRHLNSPIWLLCVWQCGEQIMTMAILRSWALVTTIGSTVTRVSNVSFNLAMECYERFGAIWWVIVIMINYSDNSDGHHDRHDCDQSLQMFHSSLVLKTLATCWLCWVVHLGHPSTDLGLWKRFMGNVNLMGIKCYPKYEI